MSKGRTSNRCIYLSLIARVFIVNRLNAISLEALGLLRNNEQIKFSVCLKRNKKSCFSHKYLMYNWQHAECKLTLFSNVPGSCIETLIKH